MENKEDIVKRLKLLLIITKAGGNVADLLLNDEQDGVTILFQDGSRKYVDIAGDSGIAIIEDVISRL